MPELESVYLRYGLVMSFRNMRRDFTRSRVLERNVRTAGEELNKMKKVRNVIKKTHCNQNGEPGICRHIESNHKDDEHQTHDE